MFFLSWNKISYNLDLSNFIIWDRDLFLKIKILQPNDKMMANSSSVKLSSPSMIYYQHDVTSEDDDSSNG